MLETGNNTIPSGIRELSKVSQPDMVYSGGESTHRHLFGQLYNAIACGNSQKPRLIIQ